ncbi:hypothetical protein [Bacteroides sp. 519]|uniref:hypothetical protein n=1 Tax=Bacteroides sp. 519 TaxID=2302937 RepID=UPI0013D662A1|nr:hypothetical protein [Bacteroides sp. 519]
MTDNNKRSIATYSSEKRIEKQKSTAARVTSSKAAATVFLKKAGILNRKGNIKDIYKTK